MRAVMVKSVVAGFVCVLFLCVSGASSYAIVGAPQKITADKMEKAQQLLVTKNFGNVTLVDGQEREINNGHFLSFNGIDKKAGKKYIVEIVTLDKSPEWLLLGCKTLEEIAARTR